MHSSASLRDANFEQGYIISPAESKFLLLFTFLKKNLTKKIMV